MNIDEFIEQQMYRFSLAFEFKDGKNTTWRDVDLNNDPENGNYHVFNYKTNKHEYFEKLSEAKARRQELINAFREELKNAIENSKLPSIPMETL
jgi:hypothetical protein